MAKQQVFYIIPKEKIVNLLGKVSEFMPDLSIRLTWEARWGSSNPSYTTKATVTVTDYPIVGRRLLSSSGSYVEGIVGSRLELEVIRYEDRIADVKRLNLDPALKEYEL